MKRTAIFGFCITALVAFVCFLFAAGEVSGAESRQLFDPLVKWFESDALDAVPMAFFAGLTLLVLVLAPKCDIGGRAVSGMLLLSAATQICFASRSPSRVMAMRFS